MKITEEAVQFCMDTLAAEVAAYYARANGMSATEALRRFMETRTFDLLMDTRSYLYLESAEYVLDMLAAERNGDWEKWVEA